MYGHIPSICSVKRANPASEKRSATPLQMSWTITEITNEQRRIKKFPRYVLSKLTHNIKRTHTAKETQKSNSPLWSAQDEVERHDNDCQGANTLERLGSRGAVDGKEETKMADVGSS